MPVSSAIVIPLLVSRMLSLPSHRVVRLPTPWRAVELAKSRGAFIYGICNAIGSSIPRATDTGTYIHVGPEIGVASTKAFTGQVTVFLTMFALALADAKGTVSHDEYVKAVKELAQIPAMIKDLLKVNDQIADMARTFTYARNFLYLGRGFSYPVALEGALKLKEISYIHAEGYPAAEMKHGPIALIDSDMPVVVIATHNAMYEKVRSNIQEIKARNGRVIALVSKGDKTISQIADAVYRTSRYNGLFRTTRSNNTITIVSLPCGCM